MVNEERERERAGRDKGGREIEQAGRRGREREREERGGNKVTRGNGPVDNVARVLGSEGEDDKRGGRGVPREATVDR